MCKGQQPGITERTLAFVPHAKWPHCFAAHEPDSAVCARSIRCRDPLPASETLSLISTVAKLSRQSPIVRVLKKTEGREASPGQQKISRITGQLSVAPQAALGNCSDSLMVAQRKLV